MKFKKILGITVLAVASTVALAACGAGGNKSAKDDKTLTVGIMTLDNTTEPVWDKVKEFNQIRLLKMVKSTLMLSNTSIS